MKVRRSCYYNPKGAACCDVLNRIIIVACVNFEGLECACRFQQKLVARKGSKNIEAWQQQTIIIAARIGLFIERRYIGPARGRFVKHLQGM